MKYLVYADRKCKIACKIFAAEQRMVLAQLLLGIEKESCEKSHKSCLKFREFKTEKRNFDHKIQ